MSKANSYDERLAELKGNIPEQLKEVVMPVVMDIGCALAGWIAGRYAGQKSLLIGLGIYAVGKYHSVRMAMTQAERRNAAEKAKSKDGKISNLIDKVYGENRVYYGDSPLATLGMAMIVGGAVGSSIASKTTEPANPWKEIKEDLKHRLYLDKIFVKKEEENTTTETEKPVSGIGEIEYFLAGNELTQNINLSELDKLDKKLEEEALRFNDQQIPAYTPSQTKADSFSGFNDPDELEGLAGTRIL
jgi:hypothetical protein